VNDASVWHDVPVVHGSIYRFEGQVTVFKPHEGPCYRCLFPEPPFLASRRSKLTTLLAS
jgi:molybdopterin/thiamine biosynthesis adenylyltransferase